MFFPCVKLTYLQLTLYASTVNFHKNPGQVGLYLCNIGTEADFVVLCIKILLPIYMELWGWTWNENPYFHEYLSKGCLEKYTKRSRGRSFLRHANWKDSKKQKRQLRFWFVCRCFGSLHHILFGLIQTDYVEPFCLIVSNNKSGYLLVRDAWNGIRISFFLCWNLKYSFHFPTSLSDNWNRGICIHIHNASQAERLTQILSAGTSIAFPEDF